MPRVCPEALKKSSYLTLPIELGACRYTSARDASSPGERARMKLNRLSVSNLEDDLVVQRRIGGGPEAGFPAPRLLRN